MPLDRRVHILLDEPRYRRVEAAAQARGTSVATIIREAIDTALPVDLERKREAWEQLKKAAPMEVPETPADLAQELEEMRAARADRLA